MDSKQYNILNQIQRTPMQVSILELLKISAIHKEILEKALVETNAPHNLDVEKFGNVVEHLIAPYFLSFSKQYEMSLNHPKNLPLCIKVLIQNIMSKESLLIEDST